MEKEKCLKFLIKLVHACWHAYIHTYNIYTCVCVCIICMYACVIYVCIYMYMYMCMCVCIYIYTYYVCICVCVCIYTHTDLSWKEVIIEDTYWKMKPKKKKIKSCQYFSF